MLSSNLNYPLQAQTGILRLAEVINRMYEWDSSSDSPRPAELVRSLEAVLSDLRGVGQAPPPASGQSPSQPELHVQISGKKVLLDSQPISLDCTPEAEAIDYLRTVIAHAPAWVSGPDIGRGIRWDRVRRRLPKVFQELIETDRRKGNPLRPAAWRK